MQNQSPLCNFAYANTILKTYSWRGVIQSKFQFQNDFPQNLSFIQRYNKLANSIVPEMNSYANITWVKQTSCKKNVELYRFK